MTLTLPAPGLVAGQLAISALDLCLAAAALYVLLPDKAGLSFFGFLPLFCVAIIAGIISHVPGGLGVFEAVMIFALGDRIGHGALVGALVVYRLRLLRLAAAAGGIAPRPERDTPNHADDPRRC